MVGVSKAGFLLWVCWWQQWKFVVRHKRVRGGWGRLNNRHTMSSPCQRLHMQDSLPDSASMKRSQWLGPSSDQVCCCLQRTAGVLQPGPPAKLPYTIHQPILHLVTTHLKLTAQQQLLQLQPVLLTQCAAPAACGPAAPEVLHTQHARPAAQTPHTCSPLYSSMCCSSSRWCLRISSACRWAPGLPIGAALAGADPAWKLLGSCGCCCCCC